MNPVLLKILGLAVAVRAFCENWLSKSGIRNGPKPSQDSPDSRTGLPDVPNETAPTSVTVAAAGFAHDLNNLLAVIIGNSQLALGEIRDPGSRRRWMEVLEAGQLAADLTQQFASSGRDELLEMQPVSPNAVIQDASELLGRLAGDRVTLKTALAQNTGAIRINALELLQVLMNLVLNARDAMPEGGTLAIETARKCIQSTESGSGMRPGCYVILTVRDNGSGIDDATKARAFEPFFSTKAASQSTGLGLAIVSAIIRKSGAHIDMKTKVGVGTAFHLYFPAPDPSHA